MSNESLVKAGKLWPVHLKPKRDEILSSWLSRLANGNGLSLYRFRSIVLPEKLKLYGDIDLNRNTEFRKILANGTGTSLNRVADTSLLAYEGYLFEYCGCYTEFPWFMPVDVTPDKQQSGLQFCPHCLLDDEEPYFRRQWRLAFATLCEKHLVSLLDRCPKCGSCASSLMGRGAEHSYNELILCPSCKSDIRVSTYDEALPTIDAEDIYFQTHLTEILEQGWVEIPGSGYVYSHTYFKVLYILSVLISASCEAVSLYFNVHLSRITIPEKYVSFERLRVNERRMILRLVRLLLQDWPTEFINFWASYRPLPNYGRFVLNGEESDIPFWFWSVLHDHVVKPRYRESIEEYTARTKYIFRKESEGEDLEKLIDWLEPFDIKEAVYY